jgi:hypothetical protein
MSIQEGVNNEPQMTKRSEVHLSHAYWRIKYFPFTTSLYIYHIQESQEICPQTLGEAAEGWRTGISGSPYFPRDDTSILHLPTYSELTNE